MNTKTPKLATTIAFVVLSALTALAQRETVGLFSTSAPESRRVTLRHRGEVRSRLAVLTNLNALPAQLRPTGEVRLSLFTDVVAIGVIQSREEHRNGSVSLAGQLAGAEGGTFAMVLQRGAMVGTVHRPEQGRAFRIESVQDGVVRIVEQDLELCPACAPAPLVVERRGGERADLLIAPASACADSDDGSRVDVAVFYTGVARERAGGAEAIEAEAQLAVDTANTTYANSGITMRLRLVHTSEVTYDENGTFQEHLDRLRNASDGIMDGVHALRDQFGADMVSLLVADDDFCGIAHTMTSLSSGFAASAFSVVNRECASAQWSFAHELGHNLGCAHDREHAEGGGLYSYSYGWRFQVQITPEPNPTFQTFRTVMAYAPGQRIPHFSNPGVQFRGVPTGMAVGQPDEANNALTINNAAYTAANWRRSVIWVDFTHTGTECGSLNQPYNSLAEGIAAAPSGGFLRIKPSQSAERPTISKRLTLEAPSGTATIGQ
jgi:hypothetical protein